MGATFIFTRDLYADYRTWCVEEDVDPLSVALFIRGVKKHRPDLDSWRWKRKNSHYKGLKGVRLKEG